MMISPDVVANYVANVGGRTVRLVEDNQYYIWYSTRGGATRRFFGATFERYDTRRRLLYFTTPRGNLIEVPAARLINVV